MANTNKNCSICGKGSILITPRNKLRGKYNPTDKKRKYPNLQWVTSNMNVPAFAKAMAGKRVKACAKCVKTQTKGK